MTPSMPPKIHANNYALREEFCRRVDIIRHARADDQFTVAEQISAAGPHLG